MVVSLRPVFSTAKKTTVVTRNGDPAVPAIFYQECNSLANLMDKSVLFNADSYRLLSIALFFGGYDWSTGYALVISGDGTTGAEVAQSLEPPDHMTADDFASELLIDDLPILDVKGLWQ
ncbi:MAG: hypothetical protein M1833_000322 [Piccolia ochrophora]|nr:MAG: hypothetical protein M1833_000322 [Piccolia ochrophora]